jgi:sugar lactone lactonase YvrE
MTMSSNLSRAQQTAWAAAVAAGVGLCAWTLSAQAPAAGRGAPAAGRGATTAPDAIAANSYPNPYLTVTDFFKMPAGRTWGSTAGVDIDRDGKTVWIIDRCGVNSCYDAATGQMSNLDPVLHFDENGKLIKSFGAGLIVFPHGIATDREGNVWITDGNDNRPGQGRGAAPAARGAAPAGAGGAAAGAERGRGPVGAAAGATKGHQVFKFSPDGKVLMTIGVPGGAMDPECCYQPNDVLVAPNGNIFIATIHGAGGGWIYKYDKAGKLLTKWGRPQGGGEPARGELNQPHTLAMDSKGRLFVGSRSCNCVQIFDQSGKFIDQWAQFSRPSGVFVDRNDNLYVADSESGASNNSTHPGGWQRGIRIGSAVDGKVKYFIPDPDLLRSGTSSAEGVAADARGTIYGAEVGQRAVKKYVRQ